MFIKEIMLNKEWQNFSDLVSVDDLPYFVINCSNQVVTIAESTGIPTEGELPLSPGATAIYTKINQDLYLKSAEKARIAVYKEG